MLNVSMSLGLSVRKLEKACRKNGRPCCVYLNYIHAASDSRLLES